MGFWSFGSQPADVELASRVVTARARDMVTVRGKLIIHFREPQTKAAADAAADACAELAARIMRDAPNHVGLIGGESLANKNLISPIWAMWIDNIIFTFVCLIHILRMGHEGVTSRGGSFAERIDATREWFARQGRRVGVSRPLEAGRS